MTVQPTLEYRTAGSDEDWTRMDSADRISWQWHDSPDWLASEALWLMGEGCEVRLVSTGIDTDMEGYPGLRSEMYGDHTPLDGGSGCLSLNSPGDDPPVPEGAHYFGVPVRVGHVQPLS